MFNNERRVAQIIKTGNQELWVVAGFHAQKGNTKVKWTEATEYLYDINNQYTHPKIIYMDINADVSSK